MNLLEEPDFFRQFVQSLAVDSLDRVLISKLFFDRFAQQRLDLICQKTLVRLSAFQSFQQLDDNAEYDTLTRPAWSQIKDGSHTKGVEAFGENRSFG